MPAIQHIEECHDRQQKAITHITEVQKTLQVQTPLNFQEILNVQEQASQLMCVTQPLDGSHSVEALVANQRMLYVHATQVIKTNEEAARNTLSAINGFDTSPNFTLPALTFQDQEMVSQEDEEEPLPSHDVSMAEDNNTN